MIDPIYPLDGSFKLSHDAAYNGHYIVVRRLPHGQYILKDETGVQLDRTVPLDQMKLVQLKQDKQDSSASNNVHVLEKILSHRVTPFCSLQYHVKWKGYSHHHNSWVDERDLIDIDIAHRYFKTGRYAKLQQAVSAISIPDSLSLSFQ